MLRFLVGTAVRTATRAAVHSHLDNQRRDAAMRAQQAQLAASFALLPNPSGETALYQDRRAGFSHALPGYPRALSPIPTPVEPVIDTLVGLAEIPVFVRYRLGAPQVQAASAVDYAVQAAQAYAAGRVGGYPGVVPARPDQAARWMVEAGALTSYPLPQADPFGADFEELIVLVRHATAMAVTIRYPRAQMDWLRQAFLSSAIKNSLLWDPQRGAYAPTIWPESAFLEPSVNGALNAHKSHVVGQIAPTIGALSMPEKEAVSAALGAIVSREEPPWAPATPELLTPQIDALLGCSYNPHFQAIVRQAAGEVRTMHDLRGLCVLLGRAMG